MASCTPCASGPSRNSWHTANASSAPRSRSVLVVSLCRPPSRHRCPKDVEDALESTARTRGAWSAGDRS
eukprot:6608027-Heterocapsa_arctica.AAC.1